MDLARPGDSGPRVPILLDLRHPESTRSLGCIDFQDCYVYDSAARPGVQFEVDHGGFGLRDVHGQIFVSGLGVPSLRLGTKLQDVDLRVMPASR